jgi:hypothetical protein
MRIYVQRRKPNRGGVKTLVTIIVHSHMQLLGGSEQVHSMLISHLGCEAGIAEAVRADVSNGSGNE